MLNITDQLIGLFLLSAGQQLSQPFHYDLILQELMRIQRVRGMMIWLHDLFHEGMKQYRVDQNRPLSAHASVKVDDEIV